MFLIMADDDYDGNYDIADKVIVIISHGNNEAND